MNVNGGFRLMVCCFALTLGVAGCGSSSSKTDTSAASSTPAHTTTTPAQAKLAPNPYPKPHPIAHPGAKVETLVIKDVVKGTGAEIHAGDTGQFDFIGSDYITGKSLDGRWNDKKGPFETAVDHGVVIDGWWQGIPGMRVGGRRQITVPPSLGFRNTGNPLVEGITSYFDVVLRGVKPAQPTGVGGGTSSTGGGAGGAGGVGGAGGAG
jgi:peptidylprolyl isomerase